MRGLFILLIIVLALLLLLICPVVLSVRYSDNATVRIRYLFISIRLYPQKEKKEKKKKNKEKKEDSEKDKKDKKDEKKPSRLKNIFKGEGVSGLCQMIKKIADTVSVLPKFIQKSLIISKLYVKMAVATDDAADTAVSYGKLCALVYPALAVLMNTLRYKKTDVQIYPDFDKKETTVNAYIKLKMSMLNIIIFSIKALIAFVKANKLIEDENEKSLRIINNKIKGSATNDRSSNKGTYGHNNGKNQKYG